MAEKQKTELNEEQIVAFLQDIVGKIRIEEDPLELNMYRRLFKKAVPFHLRSYFAAYLLKQIYTGKTPRMPLPARSDRSSRQGRRDRNDGQGNRDNREPRESRQREPREPRQRDARQEEPKRSRGETRPIESVKSEPRPILADDVSTTLFVSIGRNRRVYPRDLIGLILQNVEMERDHIGDIRVLDNYSFVQVITEDAEKIIAALNEFEYRGRKLAVSYSRKREESSNGSVSPASSGYTESADASDANGSPEPEAGDEYGPDASDAYDDSDNPDASGESGSSDFTDAPDDGSRIDGADSQDDEENNGNV